MSLRRDSRNSSSRKQLRVYFALVGGTVPLIHLPIALLRNPVTLVGLPAADGGGCVGDSLALGFASFPMILTRVPLVRQSVSHLQEDFAFIGGTLPLIGDVVPLIRSAVSFVGDAVPLISKAISLDGSAVAVPRSRGVGQHRWVTGGWRHTHIPSRKWETAPS